MFIDIKGIKTYYEIYGEGNKNILFLHGWGSSLEVFKPVCKYISKDKYKVIGIDLPGFGKTDEPKTIYSIFDYADFVKEFIDKLNLNNLVLMGHSFGGRISIILAAKYKYNKLVLIDSAGIKPRRNIKYYLKVYSYKLVKNILLMFGSKGKEILDKYRKNKGSEDYKNASETMKQILKKVVAQDLRKYMDKIESQTLLVWGDKDTATPIKDAKIMEKRIKNSGLAVIKGAGHYSFLQDPKRMARILESFI